jgi:uncharacterized protein YceK
MNHLLVILLIFLLNGCGSSCSHVATQTVIIENNITYPSYYGNGTQTNPYWLVNATYTLSEGGTWFATEVFNLNCTIFITLQTKTILDIFIQSDTIPYHSLIPIYSGITNETYSLDINSSEFITLFLAVNKNTTVSITGKCLQHPQAFTSIKE